MSDPIKSRPMFHSTACERCAFGRGQHAEWCESQDVKERKAIAAAFDRYPKVRIFAQLRMR